MSFSQTFMILGPSLTVEEGLGSYLVCGHVSFDCYPWKCPGGNHCWLRRTQRLISRLSNNILMIPKDLMENILQTDERKMLFLWNVCVLLHLQYNEHSASYTDPTAQPHWCAGAMVRITIRLCPELHVHSGCAAGQWSETRKQVHLWVV